MTLSFWQFKVNTINTIVDSRNIEIKSCVHSAYHLNSTCMFSGADPKTFTGGWPLVCTKLCLMSYILRAVPMPIFCDSVIGACVKSWHCVFWGILRVPAQADWWTSVLSGYNWEILSWVIYWSLATLGEGVQHNILAMVPQHSGHKANSSHSLLRGKVKWSGGCGGKEACSLFSFSTSQIERACNMHCMQ